MSWRLKRTKQCAKCPWRKSVNPHEIPNNYDVEKHKKLINTIAKGDGSDWPRIYDNEIHIMACHETHNAHCVGWLFNQLGPGNNILLRMVTRTCANINEIEVYGDQHERFEDTVPK